MQYCLLPLEKQDNMQKRHIQANRIHNLQHSYPSKGVELHAAK